MWYEDGSKRAETQFKRGIESGLRQTWYDNGQLKSEAEIDNGMQSGRRRFWHENGQIKADGRFTLDQLDGMEHKWDASGTWVESHCYSMDTAKQSWLASNADTQPPENTPCP